MVFKKLSVAIVLLFTTIFPQLIPSRMGPDYFVTEEAPDFTLNDIYGNTHTLKNFCGKKVILCFFEYQRPAGSWHPSEEADIVKQLHTLSETYTQLKACNIDVIAVSPGPLESLKKLCTDNKFPFAVLHDQGCGVTSRYGATEFGYVIRSTLIINEQGLVIKAILSPETSDHLVEIFLYALQQATLNTQCKLKGL